jgi:hypothetical protein
VVDIIKASGISEKFDKNKIERTVIKAGASKELARDIAGKVSKKVGKGTTTRQILGQTLNLLKTKPTIAARYDLKRAIMNLGPHGFLFEEYFAQILQNYGYKTKVGIEVQGKVVTQEIDIIAEKEKVSMIEMKYHNRPGTHTNTKVALYTYARFLDIKSNPRNKIDEPWLVTNTKCTPRAVAYSKGVGQKIVSWSYPSKGNLQELIEKKGLYPITIYKTISNPVKEKLFGAKIVLAKDLIKHSLSELKRKTGLDENILNKILDETKKICIKF